MTELANIFRTNGMPWGQTAWLALGLTAQLMFSARFLIQWLASERQGSSVVPVAFWYLSIGGSSLLVIYAIHIQDPVFILGQAAGLLIYGRNLVLIRRRPAHEAATEPRALDGGGTGDA